MSRTLFRALSALLSAAALLWAVQLTACNTENTSTPGDPPDGGGGTNSPPVVTALPGGGVYNQDLFVALNSSEPATIYYTTDGTTPAIGGLTTQSGPAPVTGIAIEGAVAAETVRVLSFFGVDSTGLASQVDTATYTIDRSVPSITQSTSPPAIGLFGTASVTWNADDDGDYVAVLGGDGSPGSGLVVAQGDYPGPSPSEPNGPTLMISIDGADLPPAVGSQALVLTLTDGGGNEATAQWTITQKPFRSTPVPTGASELALSTALGRLYVLDPGADAVIVVDADTGLEVTTLAVDPAPVSLALTPDSSALYVACSASIQRIDTATDAVAATTAVPGGAPSGLGATPDGARVWFTTDDGALQSLDTATDALDPPVLGGQTWARSTTAVRGASGAERVAIAWTDATLYGFQVWDVAAGLLGTPAPGPQALSPLPPARVVVAGAPADDSGWAGGIGNAVTRFDLVAPTLVEGLPGVDAGGLALTPGDARLVLSAADSLALEFRDPALLTTLQLAYDLSVAADDMLPGVGVGPSMQVGVTADATTRLFVVKNPQTAAAEVLAIPLD